VTPLVVTYLLFIRWVDRFEPEPWWLILAAFAWGALFATLGGGMGSSMAQALTSKAVHTSPEALELLSVTVFAPVFEETFKGLGVAIIALASALRTRHLDGPLDGAIYGGVVGLGFTLTEDILYVARQYAAGGVAGFVVLLFLRTVFLGLSHCTFTACTGLGFGIASQAKTAFGKVFAPIVGFGSAIAMHSVHNILPTVFGGGGLVLMILESWAIDVLFFVLLALLVVRDRSIVIRELFAEVGHLIDPRELKLVASYFALGLKNWEVLRTKGWGAFRARRRKQLLLVELAFIKSRRRREGGGPALDRKEAELRTEIAAANQSGVWLGS
jgi:RsiW-degrading membrane proteinase PrsW (M82 family)